MKNTMWSFRDLISWDAAVVYGNEDWCSFSVLIFGIEDN